MKLCQILLMEAVSRISAKLLDSIYNRLAITYLIHLPRSAVRSDFERT
jgi:hypothetical protein